MILYLLKYFLPVLLGYTLFVGLSGRFNPLSKPEYLEERPSWFLGLWTGMSVAVVSVVGLHMAYSMSLDGVRALLPPTALFMAVLLTPGFLTYFYYRRIVNRELHASRTQLINQDIHSAAAGEVEHSAHGQAFEFEFDSSTEDLTGQTPESTLDPQDTMTTKVTHTPVVAPLFNTADLQSLDIQQQATACQDSSVHDLGFMATSDPAEEDYMDDTIFEELHYSTLDLDDETLAQLVLTDPQSDIESELFHDVDSDQLLDMTQMHESGDAVMAADSHTWQDPLPQAEIDRDVSFEEDLQFESEFPGSDEAMNCLLESDPLSAGEEISSWFEDVDMVGDEQSDESDAKLFAADSATPMDAITNNASFLSELELLESDLRLDDGVPASIDVRDQHLVHSIDTRQNPSSSALDTQLSEEQSAHQETARQLHAARNVLTTLTSGAEGPESEQTASFLQMKSELSQSRSQQDALEGLVQQEAAKRLQLESTLAELQRNLIMSKQDVRRSTAARAKALGTANKAIAFARQTLQVRALLEEELDQLRETLTRRQDTIGSLISELEHEKERTQEEVSFMVQQLVQHEQQLKARRNLIVVKDNIDNTLPARVAKRIETQSLSSDM